MPVLPVDPTVPGDNPPGAPPAPAPPPGPDALEAPVPPLVAMFPHNVASGDPRADSVVLWTRVEVFTEAQPGLPSEEVLVDQPVRLEVATDMEFTDVVFSRDDLLARAAFNGAVKTVVDGLEPYTHYWYRFTALDATSPIGRTMTAPKPEMDVPVRFTYLSCQDYLGRFYNTLEHLTVQEADHPRLCHLPRGLHL